MKVNLTYFRKGGKYYSEGSYETTRAELFEIHNEVRRMLEMRSCPGLIKNHSNFIVSVDVPEHPHNHPRLVIIPGPE